jgi:hypothetical protein
MLNWDAIRFVNCVICEDDCTSFKGTNPTRSVCGFCIWQFNLRRQWASEEEREACFAGWLASNLKKIADGKNPRKHAKRERAHAIKRRVASRAWKDRFRRTRGREPDHWECESFDKEWRRSHTSTKVYDYYD